MTNSVIVTGADANYFELLKGLVISIRRTQPKPQDVVVLDCGLKEDHRSWLTMMDVRTVVPDWDIPVEGMGDWFKSMVARPFLPRWAPGYDIYIYLDADSWVQDWEAIEMFLGAANDREVAAVTSVDRAYPVTTGVRPENHRMLETSWDNYYREELFGADMAHRLVPFPGVFPGGFAARADSTFWNHWAARLRTAIAKAQERTPPGGESDSLVDAVDGGDDSRPVWRGHEKSLLFFVDQISFNIALYVDVGYFARLPAWCNWCCHKAYPIISERGEFLEPEYPYRRIGIVHMAAETKEGMFELLAEGGGVRTTSLRCPWVEESYNQPRQRRCTS